MPGGQAPAAGAPRTLATPSRVDSAQPKNFLQACLLLFLRESPAHGYALIERLEELGTSSDRGVVYRTLRGLEREGLVMSVWEHSTAGPAKRRYSLTDKGDDVLSTWADALRNSAHLLEQYLSRYQKATSSPR